jgi:hypothetical protein
MTDDCFEWEQYLIPVAYAKINDKGDLYDLNLQNNPYYDQTQVVTLYAMRKDICPTSKKSTEKE